MKFIKFQSLTNSYREKEINSLKLRTSADTKDKVFSVHEKIDGANFAFYYNGIDFKVASRNQFVDGGFYNCYDIIEQYKEAVIALYDNEDLESGVETLIVRGELFGHGINNRVQYGEKGFVGFGISVITADQISDDTFNEYTYNYTQADIEVLQKCTSIPFLPVLFKGSLNECLEYENTFNSTILDVENNVCEGVVIYGYYSHAKDRFGHTMIIKNKNDLFSESKNIKKRKLPAIIPKFENMETILGYINENRLDALLSKLGGTDALNPSDFGKILGMFNNDVLADLLADELVPCDYKMLGAWKGFSKVLTKHSATFLKETVLSRL